MQSFRSLTNLLLAGLVFATAWSPFQISQAEDRPRNDVFPTETAKAMFAGGCFWSVESDMAKADGVLDVITGYAGGRLNNPNYHNYAFGGHREVVLITYDPNKITFAGLVEHLIKHIDPTDPTGSFKDRGPQYSPAIFVQSDSEQKSVENVLSQIDAQHVYRRPLAVAILPPAIFWPAEAYHQDYAAHHATEYKQYRSQSGRDSFIRKHWGKQADQLQLAGSKPSATEQPTEALAGQSGGDARGKPWESFEKPSPEVLRAKLTRMQFLVTQGDRTEPEFRNAYWNNHEEGIYVDIVSGEPLFSSLDKFDSGTGWPSFSKPLEPDNLVSDVDYKMGYARVALRSKHGDCHLGHVFNDGPVAMGGLRFCMNSASLRFIPKDQLEQNGYGDYTKLFRSLDSEAP